MAKPKRTRRKSTIVPATPRGRLLDVLRRWEPAAGPDGFEGLVTQALAILTGYTFRLARSGLQFGRDAATPDAPFAIAMEAKRYTESVPVQELAGKATLAEFSMADAIDVWVLAATIEVGETHEKMLRRILDGGGMSLLTLDWPGTGLPPLGVALAAARHDLVAWSHGKIPGPDHAALQTGLDDLAADAGFDAALDRLREQLTPALVGLDAFRARNDEWCRKRFGDVDVARREFSQSLAPLAQSTTSVGRPAVTMRLEQAVRVACDDPSGDSFVLVLGGEGAGKSWAVAQWWLQDAARPILALSIGRIAGQLLSDEEPLDMLARLAAHQDGRRDAASFERWRRRLERWSIAAKSRSRFAVLLDGLNETSGKEWATIILKLLPCVRDLGGVVIATCRNAYWARDVERRMAHVRAVEVPVANYDDDEFRTLLTRNGQDPDALPPELNLFMRNPRICTLALSLLPNLPGIEGLTVERLLMEYWRARLRERGDLLGHTDIDFAELLKRHAREYRARPGVDFSRDEWRLRSGAAQRDDGRNLANDLSDIEEGAFFEPGEHQDGRYGFKNQALPFAMGLLLADDLRAAARENPDTSIDELLSSVLDPVRGFDQMADIVSAAIAIATLDAGFPARALPPMVSSWMSLQNVSDDGYLGLVPYVGVRPEAFLDAFESRPTDRDDGRFVRLLLFAAREEAVSTAIADRVPRWFGSWSRASQTWGDPSEQAKRRRQREERIDGHLADLTVEERTWFEENCPEHEGSLGLAATAALYVLGERQTPFAKGIVAYAFASAVASDYDGGYEDVAWAIRLNRVDHRQLAAAVRDEVVGFNDEAASATARTAAASALRLLGTVADQLEAERLMPLRRDQLERPRETDPLDPDATAPDVIEAAAARLDEIDAAMVWTEMGNTMEDHDVERRINMLARFAPERLADYLDRLASTVTTRTGMALRQLGWHLPWIGPVLRPATVAAVVQRIADIGVDPSIVPEGDQDFVTGMMVEAVLPHLGAEAQLDLLQSLPSAHPYLLRYETVAKPLPAVDLVRSLTSLGDGDPRIVERTLLFASGSVGETDAALRSQIIECLEATDEGVRGAAAEYCRRHPDDALDDAVLALPVPDAADRSWSSTVLKHAFASSVSRRKRQDRLGDVAPEHLDWVTAEFPGAMPWLADAVDLAVDRLTKTVISDEPSTASIVLRVDDDGVDTRIDLVDRGEAHENPIEAWQAATADDTFDKFADRQRIMAQQLDRFLDDLEREGARMIAQRPLTMSMDELARVEPDRYAGWVSRILATEDHRLLRNVQNLGFALAQGLASVDPARAAELFAHLWRVDPHIEVVLGRSKLPIRDMALFRSPSSPEIGLLRERAFERATDDERIETLVLAAEAADAGSWLSQFVDARVAGDAPADQALAITIASFRPANPQSDNLLTMDWGRGFVGSAATAGATRYGRARHADHWFKNAKAAGTFRERWRLLELAIASADRRHVLRHDPALATMLRETGGDAPQRINKAIQKVSDASRKTLFGLRKPTGLLEVLARQ